MLKFIAPLFFLLILIVHLGYAQDSLQIQWQKRIGDDFIHVLKPTPYALDRQDNLYILGEKTSIFDSLGTERWKWDFSCQDLKIDSNGNFIFIHQSLGGHVQLTKMDHDSTIQWIIDYPGWDMSPMDSIIEIERLILDESDHIYVFGNLIMPFADRTFWAARYSTTGKLDWTLSKKIGEYGYWIKKITRDNNCDIVVCADGGLLDEIHLFKIDKSGKELWHTFYKSENYLHASDCAIDNENNILISAGSLLLKYDMNGTLLWHKIESQNLFERILLDKKNFIFATGRHSLNDHSYTDLGLWKFSPDGLLLWESFHDGPAQKDDGGFVLLLGKSGNIFVAGIEGTGWPLHNVSNYVILKYDSLGNKTALSRYDISTNDKPLGLSFWGYRKLLMVGNSSADDGFMPEIVLFCFAIDKDTFIPVKKNIEEFYIISVICFPNPSNGVVRIKYTIPFSSNAILNLYNLMGNPLLSIDLGFQKAGDYDYYWSPSNLPSGNYFIEIKTAHQRAVCKAILLK